MTNYPGQDKTEPAARLLLEGLASLCGLGVDTPRVALLQPLADSLLQHGERLARTTEPATEPYFIGAMRTWSDR